MANEAPIKQNSDKNIEAQAVKSTPTPKTDGNEVQKPGKERLYRFAVQVLSFLGAIVLWFYVMGVNSPTYEKQFTDIPVTIVGSDVLRENHGYTILSGTDVKIDIVVMGRKSDIAQLRSLDIQVQADVSGLETVGENVCSLNVVLPAGLTAVSMSASNISLYVDKSISKSIPVKVTHTGYITTGLILGSYQPSPSAVLVEGPENVVNNIDGAYADLTLDKIEGSVNARQKLILKNKEGEVISNPYVSMRTLEVDVYIPVYQEKSIPVTVEFEDGVYPQEKAEITIEPSVILIRGLVENMGDINSVVLGVHESQIDGDYQASIPISLPTGIENRSGKTSALVTINLPTLSSRNVVVNDIEYRNKPLGLSYSVAPVSSSISVRLMGEAAALLNFDVENNLSAYVDLSELDGKSAGTYQLPVTVETNFESTNVYSFGTYYVDIIVE